MGLSDVENPRSLLVHISVLVTRLGVETTTEPVFNLVLESIYFNYQFFHFHGAHTPCPCSNCAFMTFLKNAQFTMHIRSTLLPRSKDNICMYYSLSCNELSYKKFNIFKILQKLVLV